MEVRLGLNKEAIAWRVGRMLVDCLGGETSGFVQRCDSLVYPTSQWIRLKWAAEGLYNDARGSCRDLSFSSVLEYQKQQGEMGSGAYLFVVGGRA